MTTIEIGKQIVAELEQSVSALQQPQIDALEQHIRKAGKIYVVGAGRSLMMIRGLAMRLMHMGYRAYVIGETVTPAASEGDLLIIGSGSGETGSLKLMAEKAKKLGVKLALITTKPGSTIGSMADCVVEVQAVSKGALTDGPGSVQLGANLFEQTLLVLCDAIVIHLLDGKDIDEANVQLMKMHANLE